MGTGPREWDASTYDRVAAPMTRMGSAVLDRLPLRGDEVVLDAGCGSGQVNAKLATRLPRGRVIALDAGHVGKAREMFADLRETGAAGVNDRTGGNGIRGGEFAAIAFEVLRRSTSLVDLRVHATRQVVDHQVLS